MADRNRYTRRNRYQDWDDRDERGWRQQEQFSDDRWDTQPEYREGYGYQTGEPYGTAAAQRPNDYEAGWDRNTRYGQGGTGYARRNYAGEGEYGYGPARYETAPDWRGSSFTMEDQGGRDFTAPARRNYGAYGGYGAGYPGYGGYGAGYFGYGPYGGYGGGTTYGYPAAGDRAGRRHDRGYDRNRRDWFDRAGDEIMSWFGDEDAARRRRMDHSGRGPQNYTRSDDRIREDVNDNLTDDWAVDARNITVKVNNGEVTLDGTVATRLQKRRAEDCAEDVSGVKHVQNNLRVEERSSWERNTASEADSDTKARANT